MKLKLPRYVRGFVDRHGIKVRYYFRREGRQQVPLPGLPYSPEFMAAYETEMSGEVVDKQIGASRTIAGTVNAAIISYYASSAFCEEIGDSTRANRRAILERFREEHGDKRIALLGLDHVHTILGSRKRHAARNLLKTLRGLMKHCVAAKLIKTDPTVGITVKVKKSDGFHTWTEEEIERFEAVHPIGSKARLAIALMKCTGLARADVVRLGRQHIRGDAVSLPRQKTGTQSESVVLPELRAVIDATPGNHLTFLVTEFGAPFTAAGFGNWFADRCVDAGVPGRAHGLRKAAATRMAENGATPHELCAWFGWKSLKEAEPYTAAANRKKLAQAGAAKLISGTSIGKPATQFANSPSNPLKEQVR